MTTFGTGPQALVNHLARNWQASRSGRPDVPDVVRDSGGTPLTGGDAVRAERGVLIAEDRDVVANQHAVHDLVHCYHPQAAGLSVEDKGYQEQGVVETVQIDVEATDRTDESTGERLTADRRLVGDRSEWGGSVAFTSPQLIGDAQYPGLLGEVKYILELGRRGFEEYEVASHDVVNLYLGNSNASASFTVDLEWVALNTADA